MRLLTKLSLLMIYSVVIARLKIQSMKSFGLKAEKVSLTFRRSLYISQDMQKGDTLTAENLKSVRPGLGLAPKYYDVLLGKQIGQDVRKGTPMSWEILA